MIVQFANEYDIEILERIGGLIDADGRETVPLQSHHGKGREVGERSLCQRTAGRA